MNMTITRHYSPMLQILLMVACNMLFLSLLEKCFCHVFFYNRDHLYFVPGLQFDRFSIHYINESVTFTFGLPEVHWNKEKAVNFVVSMLHQGLSPFITLSHASQPIWKLFLHSENCLRHNKNQYIHHLFVLEIDFKFSGNTFPLSHGRRPH